MNKIILIGNLSRDPEASETQNGTKYCRFSIAVNRQYEEDGERKADFFNVIAWRGLAENCGRYLKKGSKIGLVGTLQNRTYETREGEKRTITEVIAADVEFLSRNENSDDNAKNGGNNPETATQRTFEKPTLEETDDDLPF